MLNDLARLVEAKDVDAGPVAIAGPVLVAVQHDEVTLGNDPPDFDPPTALDVLVELEPESLLEPGSLLDPESPELEPPPLLPEPPEPLAPLAARESVR